MKIIKNIINAVLEREVCSICKKYTGDNLKKYYINKIGLCKKCFDKELKILNGDDCK